MKHLRVQNAESKANGSHSERCGGRQPGWILKGLDEKST